MKKYLSLVLVLLLTACDTVTMHCGTVVAKATGSPDYSSRYITVQEGSEEIMFSVSSQNYNVLKVGDKVYFNVSKHGSVWLEARVEEQK